MRFGPWHPWEQAAVAAPPTPGLLQARAEALLAFPGGRSAMVLYAATAADEPLDAFVRGRGAAALAAAHGHGARWVRFAAHPEPAAALAILLARFEERFGAPPPGNGR